MKQNSTSGFGLLIIGNEILDGRRQDSHFAAALKALRERDLNLEFALTLPDDVDTIRQQLEWAFARSTPFFCCGGIGATPDDLTRECAAAANGVCIERHAEGEALLRNRWGADATEGRLRMIDFPAGSVLIPNPFNQIPGFRLKQGHFLPGFPEMAQPMMQWVLETWYEPGQPTVRETLVLPGAREADLSDIMERFVALYPDLSFSSLPRYVGTSTELHLGIRGVTDAVDKGIKSLKQMLTQSGYDFTIV
jgi:molybdopterin-biosynthesis enzyme MoeA-like protein